MKLKSLLFVCCLSLMPSAFADNRHLSVNADSTEAKLASKSAVKKVKSPGYCEIEIFNYSYDDLRVWGRVSNGGIVNTFYIPYRDVPHYIDLFDYNYGYCPDGMNLYIETMNGYPVYSKYTLPNTTINVVPYADRIKAEVRAK